MALGALLLWLMLPRSTEHPTHPALWWGLAIFLGQMSVCGLLWLSAWLNGGLIQAGPVARVMTVAVGLFLLLNSRKLPALLARPRLPTRPNLAYLAQVRMAPTALLFLALSALLCLHVVQLWHEVLLRPSYGADTLSLLGLRAKHLHLGMNVADPFIIGENYPLFISLLRLWPNVWQAEFREVLPNVSWGVAYLGILLTMYGGLRQHALRPLWALVATYALASVPLLGIHIALSGYVDFHVAYGILAALLCLGFAIKSRRLAWWLVFFVCVFAVSKMKRPTIYWGVLLLASAWVGASALMPLRRWWQGSVGMGLVGGLAVLAVANKGALYYQEHFNLKTFNIMPEMFVENLWIGSSYNLLWTMLVMLLLYAWRQLSAPAIRAPAFFVLSGLLVTVLSVGLTASNPYWAVQTVINRSLLHFVPSMVLLMALLWHAQQAADAPPRNEEPTAGA
ncbi:MAG: hypothetical protein RLZZ502_952 [Pseudomonadota bacterium]|jgi:hypothetical protein